jgi:hypothetical protein
MCRRFVLSFLGAMLAVAAISAPGLASTFVALDSQSLVRDSDAVVQGRVLGIESFWDEQGRIIVTEARVQVEEAILGEPESIVLVRTPGGTVGDFTVEAHGFPRLEAGSEVILFLDRARADGTRRLVGHQQGHFDVVERLDGVRMAVPRIEDGVRLLLPSGRPMPEPRSIEVDELKNRVLTLAGRAGRPQGR